MADQLVHVRELGAPGDIGWVIMAHGEIYAQEYGWDTTFETLVAGIVADFAGRKGSAAGRRERGWIAEVDGVRAGCVLCCGADESTAQLRVLLVTPEARGLHLGSQLVDKTIEFARAAGYTRMRLWTNHPLVAARAVYLSRGFELAEQERHRSYGADLIGQVYELDLHAGQPGAERQPQRAAN